MKLLQVFLVIVGLLFTASQQASAAFVAATPLYAIDAIPGGVLVAGNKQFSNFALDGIAFGGAVTPTPSDLMVQAGQDTVTGQYGLRFRMAYYVLANQTLDALLSFQVSSTPASPSTLINGATMTLTTPSLGASGGIAIGESIFATSSTAVAPVGNIDVSATPTSPPELMSDSTIFAPLATAYIRKDILLYGGAAGGVTHMSEFFQYYQQAPNIVVPEPTLTGLAVLGVLGSSWFVRRRNRHHLVE